MLFLSIPTPCHENWDAMLPNEKGAFCQACAKTVVDFTGMSDEEVAHYFLRHRGQKTCGRFTEQQVVPAHFDLPHLLSASLPFWKKFLAVAVIVFSSLLTGCADSNAIGKASTHNLGDTTYVEPIPAGVQQVPSPDTSKPAVRLMGDTVELPESIRATLQRPKLILKKPAQVKLNNQKVHADTTAKIRLNNQ